MPPLTHELCLDPEPPVFEIINEDDPENVKLRKLLDNIVKQNSYVQKLKAVIRCLRGTAQHKDRDE